MPAKLLAGLEAAGCETAPVNATFRGGGRLAQLLGLSWAQQTASPAYSAVRGAVAGRALRGAGRLDGVVAIGSGYLLSTELPTATFEDMTVAQALRLGGPTYESLSERGAARWRKRQRLIYERSRACCVASRWTGSSVRDDYGIPAEKIKVVGVGRNAEPTRLARDWSVPRFLFVGADWSRKRGDAVVAAFTAVRQRHPEASLNLVGDHPAVEAEGIVGHGRLPLDSADGQERYRGLLARATCFVMPSTYEPFGIAYLDAAASGVPSIGTTVGGAPDAVGDGGVVVDPDDDGALSAAMLAMADPETARRLGERAFGRSDLFTWRAVAERMLRALQPSRASEHALADFLPPVEAEAVQAR